MPKETEQLLGTCVVVVDNENRILLGKRKNSFMSGSYGLPGGRLRIGEPLEDCAKREVKEETTLKAIEVVYLGTIRDHQKTYDFIHFAFACTQFKGQVTLAEPDKCESWEWIVSDDIPPNILPSHKAAIDLFKEKVLTGDSSGLVEIIP